MTESTLTAAAARLARVLEAENAALTSLDYAATGLLLAEKQEATAALTAAQADAAFTPAAMKPLALQLNVLAEENRRLLERAITVQRRVLGTVAQAAQAAAVAPPYGRGGVAAARSVRAVALRANA